SSYVDLIFGPKRSLLMCPGRDPVLSAKGVSFMKRDINLFERIVVVFVMLILSAGILPGALAQDKEKKPPKDRNEQKKKDELKSVYKRWMDEDVSYIINDEERK